MLRNAIRELERRRPVPCDLTRSQPTSHCLPLRRSVGDVATQTAITTHDAEEPVGIQRHDRSSQVLASRRRRVGTSPNRRSSHESHPDETARYQRRRDDHHVRPVGRRNRLAVEIASQPGHRYGRRRLEWTRAQPWLSKTWRHQSPSTLLNRILEPREDVDFWRRQVALARSSRLSIIVLQLLIRKEESRQPGTEILDLLPSPVEWKRLLEVASESGHNIGKMHYYLRILQGTTDDMRCRRFLHAQFPLPRFIFNFLVRPSSRITSVYTLRLLILHFEKLCKESISGLAERNSLEAKGAPRLTALGSNESIFSAKLLAYHCICLEPRLLPLLAKVAAQHIRDIATLPMSSEKIYRTQCVLFNDTLKAFQSQLRRRPAQRLSPDAFFWEAQRILLAMSAEMKRPLIVSREGFRAIRSVLSGLPKNRTEAYSSLRQAHNWPPYLQPADGMDEAADPEDGWSRVVRAGMLMQEAGFAKEEADEAVDVLQGMAVDGTPTIQQRARPAQQRTLSVWEASIRATRNAHEAWERFRKPPEAGLTAGLSHYAAMFEKLVLREADAHARVLPGDKALSFATRQEANLTELEKARLRPPSVAQLYDRMRGEGIRPGGHCLRILVGNAESLETAHRYLSDSRGGHEAARAMYSDDADRESLRAVEPGLFAAYIQALMARHTRRSARNMMQAIRMARSRMGSSRSPLAQVVWGAILKNLSQHHGALRITQAQQFQLVFYAVEQMRGRDGIPLAAFIQLSKCMRKAARWEVGKLAAQIASDDTAAAHNSLLRLYDGRMEGGKEAEEPSPGMLLRRGAARMKELHGRLAAQERESQRVLGGTDGVAALDRMAWRKDVVRSEDAHEYLLALAYVGEFEEMAAVVRGLAGAWAVPEVVEALREMDEPPPSADFFEVLCAFRMLAEPMVEAGTVESVRQAVAAGGLGWAWPDEEAVRTYAAMQDESIATLARVLEWTRGRMV